MKPIVDARIKLHRKKWLTTARILCGRETRPRRFDCAGVLGTLDYLTRAKHEDRCDESNYMVKSGGVASAPSIGGEVMSLGLTGCQTAQEIDLGGDGVCIWVAYHPRAYRLLPNGDFEVCREVSRDREPWRFQNGRATGIRPVPPDMANAIGLDNFDRFDDLDLGTTRNAYGRIGKRPALPAVIQCPRCDARNLVPPKAFDLETRTRREIDGPFGCYLT